MIAVTGIGWVTPGGIGRGRNYETLPSLTGELPVIPKKDIFDKPFMRFGRLDTYSKVGITSAALALKDAGLYGWTEKRNIGIVASTVTGCLATDADYFDTVTVEDGRLASPNLFAYTLPNSFIGETALFFGLTGSNFIIQEEPLTGLGSLVCAMLTIAGNDSDIMLAGICDTGYTEIPGPDNGLPTGSIFVVLESEGRTGVQTYGHITEMSGRICFHDKPVDSLLSIVTTSISTKYDMHRK